MEHMELAIETGPLDPDAVARLKHAGHQVFQGKRSWRVIVTADVHAGESVRAQAHVVARQVIEEFGLPQLSDPPAVILRDPDTFIDTQGAQLLLNETHRAYDPDPLPRPKRKWYQVAMELGLGERKV